MAITYVGSTSNSAESGANVTLTLTNITGLAQDDIVFVAYSESDFDDNDMAMVDAGWTEVSDLFQVDVFDCNFGVFYKIMGVTPDTSATVDGHGDVNSPVVAVAMGIRGVDTTTPLDVAVTNATGKDYPHPNPPSINYDDAGCAVLAVGASANNSGGTQTATFPTGYTTYNVEISKRDPTVTRDSYVGMALNTAPSDPEDPGEFTLSGGGDTADTWCATTIALRPAASGGGGSPFNKLFNGPFGGPF
jgi:hypothetical protein